MCHRSKLWCETAQSPIRYALIEHVVVEYGVPVVPPYYIRQVPWFVPRACNLLILVMYRAWLGLKALAWAWL
jgi:hypothetical protein